MKIKASSEMNTLWKKQHQNLLVQWKPLIRAVSAEKKTILSFSSYKLFAY